MKHILFGVSDSIECRKAVNGVIKLFSGISEFKVTLLHVVSEVIIYAENGIYDYDNTILKEIESDKLLNELEEIFASHNIIVDKIVREGNAADILLEIAKDYDLLVIGESESSIFHRIFNSHQNLFINSSPISVLVAK